MTMVLETISLWYTCTTNNSSRANSLPTHSIPRWWSALCSAELSVMHLLSKILAILTHAAADFSFRAQKRGTVEKNNEKFRLLVRWDGAEAFVYGTRTQSRLCSLHYRRFYCVNIFRVTNAFAVFFDSGHRICCDAIL